MGVHWKIQFLRGVTKHLYRKGEIAQKRGTGLRGGLGKGHGGCFWQGGGGGWDPRYTLCESKYQSFGELCWTKMLTDMIEIFF